MSRSKQRGADDSQIGVDQAKMSDGDVVLDEQGITWQQHGCNDYHKQYISSLEGEECEGICGKDADGQPDEGSHSGSHQGVGEKTCKIRLRESSYIVGKGWLGGEESGRNAGEVSIGKKRRVEAIDYRKDYDEGKEGGDDWGKSFHW